MSRIYIPANRPEDWRLLLAKPGKHWRTGYSAKTLAYSCEEDNTKKRGTAPIIINRLSRCMQAFGMPGISRVVAIDFPHYPLKGRLSGMCF